MHLVQFIGDQQLIVWHRQVRVNIFLTTMANYTEMNDAYSKAFSKGVKPVRTCVAVAELPRGTDVEIEITAIL